MSYLLTRPLPLRAINSLGLLSNHDLSFQLLLVREKEGAKPYACSFFLEELGEYILL